MSGMIKVREVLVFKSPRKASSPERRMVAFLTRYGPPTRIVSLEPNCQYELKSPLDGMTGDQKELAVLVSANRTNGAVPFVGTNSALMPGEKLFAGTSTVRDPKAN